MSLRRVAVWTAKRAPRIGYALAWISDWLAHRTGEPLSERPAAEGEMNPLAGASIDGIPDLALAARAPWSDSARYALIAGAFGSSRRPWPRPLDVRWAGAHDVRSPTVLATVHLGPMEAAGLLLGDLDGPVLAFTAGMPSRPGIRTVDASGGEWSRTAGMLEAVRCLRAGGSVFLAVDAGESNARVDIPLLGRKLSIASGGFALARLSGAPLVPVATRWRDRRIEIEPGPRISAASDQEMGAALAAWLEQFVLVHPVDLGRPFVDELLSAPVNATTGACAAAVPGAPGRV